MAPEQLVVVLGTALAVSEAMGLTSIIKPNGICDFILKSIKTILSSKGE